MITLPQVAALLAAVSITSTSVVKSPTLNSDGNFELLILHNNDMHARFEQTSQLSGTCTTADRDAGKCYGGFARVAHVVKEARQAAASGQGPPVLYLNAGDTYTGTAWFTIYKWKIAAEFINALQPDAVSLGNHEFDDDISGLTPFIQSLTCPVLAANLILNKVPELALHQNLKKSIVFEVAGTKIGVVGYVTPDTKASTRKNDVEFTEEIAAIQEEVDNLKSDGVNILIALGHSGYAKDQQIAKEVKDLDLVIGGHTHSFLWNGTVPDREDAVGPYPTYVAQDSGRLVPVVQAYAYTKYLGRLRLIFDSNGEITYSDGIPILLDKSIPQDPEIIEILDRYRVRVQSISDEVVGNTSIALDGQKCNIKECNLGNLIADSMVHYYAKLYSGDHWTDTPIGVIQSGGIRASIVHTETPSNITKGDLLTVMPFKGPLATITVNGSILLQMLEHSVANYDGSRVREFLQVSGLKVVYNLNKEAGSRVVSVEARCWACTIPEYFKVEARQMYKVIMPAIIAQGGDGFVMLKDLPQQELPYNELVCTLDYVRTGSPIYSAIEGRITLLNDQNNLGVSSTSFTSTKLLGLLVFWSFYFVIS